MGRRDRDLRLLVRDLGHDAVALLDAVARHERRVVQGIDVGVDRASLSKIYSYRRAAPRSRESNDDPGLAHGNTRQGLRRDDLIFFRVVSH